MTEQTREVVPAILGEALATTSPKRNNRKVVARLRKRHATWTQARIAQEVGITRERVRQILKEEGLSTVNSLHYTVNPRLVPLCMQCSEPRGYNKQFCSRLCRMEHAKVSVVCDDCSTIFVVGRSDLTARKHRSKLHRLYHNRACWGKYAGSHYGWGNPDHPIHRQSNAKLNVSSKGEETV